MSSTINDLAYYLCVMYGKVISTIIFNVDEKNIVNHLSVICIYTCSLFCFYELYVTIIYLHKIERSFIHLMCFDLFYAFNVMQILLYNITKVL